MFKEIYSRLKAKSPKFFNDLKKIAMFFGGTGIVIITANTTLGLTLDPIFIKVLSYLIVLCIGITGTSQLTRE